MKIDNLQTTWDATSRSFDNYDNSQPRLPRDARTTLDRLADRYRRFVFVSLAATLCTPLFASSEFVPQSLRLPLTLIMLAYFLTAGLMDLWLYNRLHGLDIFNAPVERVATDIIRCRRMHLRFMMMLIPFALVVVGLMAYIARHDTGLLIGMATGGAIGLFIGTIQFLRFMRDYRLLATQLSDDE